MQALDCNISEKSNLGELILRYNDVFVLSESELTVVIGAEHDIDTGAAAPIKQSQRPVPLALREAVREKLDQMLAQGIITESNSPWSSPLVIVRKKDGSLRLCVDYRRLNQITIKDSYSLPNMDATLQSSCGKKSSARWIVCKGFIK